MVVIATAKIVPIKLPVVLDKNGVRYTCDIADDDKGIDLVITKDEEVKNENEGEGK